MICTCQCCQKEYESDYDFFIYSICPHCMWEQDNVDEGEYSDPNGDTLEGYRAERGIVV